MVQFLTVFWDEVNRCFRAEFGKKTDLTDFSIFKRVQWWKGSLAQQENQSGRRLYHRNVSSKLTDKHLDLVVWPYLMEFYSAKVTVWMRQRLKHWLLLRVGCKRRNETPEVRWPQGFHFALHKALQRIPPPDQRPYCRADVFCIIFNVLYLCARFNSSSGNSDNKFEANSDFLYHIFQRDVSAIKSQALLIWKFSCTVNISLPFFWN